MFTSLINDLQRKKKGLFDETYKAFEDYLSSKTPENKRRYDDLAVRYEKNKEILANAEYHQYEWQKKISDITKVAGALNENITQEVERNLGRAGKYEDILGNLGKSSKMAGKILGPLNFANDMFEISDNIKKEGLIQGGTSSGLAALAEWGTEQRYLLIPLPE